MMKYYAYSVRKIATPVLLTTKLNKLHVSHVFLGPNSLKEIVPLHMRFFHFQTN